MFKFVSTEVLCLISFCCSGLTLPYLWVWLLKHVIAGGVGNVFRASARLRRFWRWSRRSRWSCRANHKPSASVKFSPEVYVYSEISDPFLMGNGPIPLEGIQYQQSSNATGKYATWVLPSQSLVIHFEWLCMFS